MDSVLIESLDKWKKSIKSEEQEANVHLLLILNYIHREKNNLDSEALDHIRFTLEQSIEGVIPENWDSYNLGMARTINQMLSHEITKKHKTYILEALSPQEKN